MSKRLRDILILITLAIVLIVVVLVVNANVPTVTGGVRDALH